MAARLRRIRSTSNPLGAVESALAAAVRVLADEVGRTSELLESRSRTETIAVESELAARRARPVVVLVDDDPAALETLGLRLGFEFEVVTTADPFEGLEMARRSADAVITDLHMPGLDGLGLLRLLRADPATAEVPCLLLTADTAVMEKRTAFDHGAADYITKPVDSVELIARLHARIEDARRRAAERELHEIDDLTALPNRRALRRALTHAHVTCQSHAAPLTIVLVDADGLKRINDTWGHAIGDLAICRVADALRRCKRGRDTAARIGGDEFAVVLPDTDLQGATRFIVRVREALQGTPILTATERIAVKVSCGAATLDDAETIESLLDRADRELYACKRARTAGRDKQTP